MPPKPARLAALRSYATQVQLPPPPRSRNPSSSSPRPPRPSSAVDPSSAYPSSSDPSASASGSGSASSAATSTLSTHMNSARRPRKDGSYREYPARKQFLFDYYTHISDTSPLILVYEYDNCSSKMLEGLRTAIKKIPPPALPFDPTCPPLPPATAAQTEGESETQGEASSSASISTSSPSVSGGGGGRRSDTRAKFMMVRSGVLAAVQKLRPDDISLLPWCEGQRAFLICPTISPSYLDKVTKTIAKFVADNQLPPSSTTKVKQPALNLLVGLLEGNRVMPASQVRDVFKLPEMDTLRAQVVGMLEGQGRSLVGVLSQAGGQGLVRTLKGLEADLKEKEGAAGGDNAQA